MGGQPLEVLGFLANFSVTSTCLTPGSFVSPESPTLPELVTQREDGCMEKQQAMGFCQAYKGSWRSLPGDANAVLHGRKISGLGPRIRHFTFLYLGL